MHHDTFAQACSLQGGSPEAAGGFWGTGAERLMLSSTAAVRRQLPGLVPGKQPSCLALQCPAHVPHCVYIWGWRGAEGCQKVGEMGVPTSPGGDALEGRSLLKALVLRCCPGEEDQAGSHFSPAAMGLGELGGTKTPKPAQQGLVTPGTGSEAVFMAGKAKQSPHRSSQGEGTRSVLLHLPSTCGVRAGGRGSTPRDGDVCKHRPTSCFFP